MSRLQTVMVDGIAHNVVAEVADHVNKIEAENKALQEALAVLVDHCSAEHGTWTNYNSDCLVCKAVKQARKLLNQKDHQK